MASLDYWAGLFDGEGCIHIRKAPQHCLVVSLSGAYKPTIEALQHRFGGGLSLQRPGTATTKPMWKWSLGHAASVVFLRDIRPLLREKAFEAWLALEFDSARTVDEHRAVPTAEVAIREGFYLAMREAKRG